MSASEPNLRNKKLSAVLQRAVEQTLSRGLADPRIRGLISVTKLELSQDLKLCTVNVSVYPQEHEKLTMHGLKDATAHIRRKVADQVHIREMPRLTFKLDEGLKKQAEVMELLAKARSEYNDESSPDPGRSDESPETTDEVTDP